MKNLLYILAFLPLSLFAQEKTITKYFASGETKSIYTVDDSQVSVTNFYENGTIKEKGFYNNNGNPDGVWTSFDTNGNKNAQAFYVDGQKEGIWLHFDNSNKTVKQVTYSGDLAVNLEIKDASDVMVSDQ